MDDASKEDNHERNMKGRRSERTTAVCMPSLDHC